jgi:hypothetical protein
MKRQPIASSNIKSVGFENGVMHIEFANGGRVYEYTGPRVKEHYDALLKAESAGRYFSQHIRNDLATKARPL